MRTPERRHLVALLPMKAHSERVRGKNFREFRGKPLSRWILDTLLAMPEIDLVCINTDARGILAANGLAEGPRLRIRDRRPEICGDSVSMNAVLADDLAHVAADAYLMTHATNPLLRPETIRAALADSLFSVNKVQARFYRADGSAVNHDPDHLVRTQDLEPWFEENSNLYLFTRESFAASFARIGEKPLLFETPRLESIDIDDQDDWNFAVAAAGMCSFS